MPSELNFCIRGAIAIATALAGAALLTASGQAAAAAPRVVVAPKPGQVINTHPVRIVVRAGPEHGDLSARLNGVEVGEHFARVSHNRRVLRTSNSHGLRHGRNVLRVSALHNGNLRRARVPFTVGHKRHLAGAGRDRIIPAGMRVELRGRVRSHRSRDFGGRVRWRVVRAPAGSRFKREPTAQRPAAERAALGSRTTLTPAFKPDVLGTYKLELRTGVGAKATIDRQTVSAVPQQPVVPIETAVPPGAGDPRWGIRLTCPSPCGSPGVAGEVFRAPWMRKSGDGSSYSGTRSDGVTYTALWQVLSLERSTLKFNWNRTYGVCVPSDPSHAYVCRRGDNGEPTIVNAPGPAHPAAINEITQGGDDSLVIVRSHPSLASLPDGSGTWSAPNQNSYATTILSNIGLPTVAAFTKEINAAGSGAFSMIGVPGMKGSAQVAVVAGRGLSGYLTPDQHKPTPNYGFTPSARAEFNTRADMECTSVCHLSQTIGDQTHTSPNVANGAGGYLVTANDVHTLELLDSRFFETMESSNGAQAVADMASYLTSMNADGAVVTITSLKTPAIDPTLSLAHPNSFTKDWDDLADQIVALGGTRHRFLLSAISHDADYSMVGWSTAEEGDGVESIDKDATVRGTLIPDEQYRFRPINTTVDGSQPPNKLANLLAQPPSSTWPQNENDADGSADGGDRALNWLARQFPTQFGTADPRVAYWAAPIDEKTAGDVRDDLTHIYTGRPAPAGQSFTQDDYDWAVDQLYTELGWVSNTRAYMKGLAYPTGEAADKAWQNASIVGDQLISDLKILKEKSEVSFDPISMLEGVADFAAAAFGAPKFENIVRGIHVISGLLKEAGVLYEAKWDGSSAVDEIQVEADDLGVQIQQRLQSTSATFGQMASIIISDPVKLAEVGAYGGCKLPVGGCAGGYDEYSYTTDPDQAAAKELAELGVERELWQELVPLAFPVWDIAAHDQSFNTSKTTAAVSEDAIDLDNFSCNAGLDFGLNNPFPGSPPLARSGSLQHITPNLDAPEKWRVRISVGRSGSSYSWLTPAQLEGMFGSVESGGLAIDPHDWMRDAEPAYVPADNVLCGWKK